MLAKKHNQFITYLIIYTLMLFLSNDAYLPALPQMMRDIHTSYHGAQLTMTMWFLGSASIELILGPLSDRFGKRAVVLLGGLCFVLSSFLCAFANNLMLLLIARFIQGASVASMLVAGMACIHELYESNQAVKVLGKMNSITILAPALGPLLGAVLLYVMTWRDIFVSLAVVAFLCLVGIYYKMPRKIDEKHSLNIKKIATIYKRIISNKSFMINSMSYCCLFASLIAWITVGPFIIVDFFHLSEIMFAIFQMIIFGSFILGSLSLKLQILSDSQKYIIKVGLIAAVMIATIMLVVCGFWPEHFIFGLITPLCFFAFIAGALMPILSRKAIDATDTPSGATLAIQSTLLCSFGALSSALVSYFYHNSLRPLTIIVLGFSLISLLSFGKRSSVVSVTSNSS